MTEKDDFQKLIEMPVFSRRDGYWQGNAHIYATNRL